MQCQGQYSKRPNINISTRKVIFVVLFYDFCQENPFLSEKQPWVLKGRCCTWSELNHKFLGASDGEESFGCAYFELMSIDLGLRLIGLGWFAAKGVTVKGKWCPVSSKALVDGLILKLELFFHVWWM